MRFSAALVAILGTLLGATALPALAEDTLRGKANIVDGDTIDIAGIPIRLQGIDAPEQIQKCTSDGGQVACGKLATRALVGMIGSAPVTCILLGKDNYDRMLGECSANGQSLNARMVQDGWAPSEEGLDQAFNSLDAQREASAAFVVSQKHEGWSVLPTLYDDGGYSGGTLDRPALVCTENLNSDVVVMKSAKDRV